MLWTTQVILTRKFSFKYHGNYSGVPIMASNADCTGTFQMAEQLYEVWDVIDSYINTSAVCCCPSFSLSLSLSLSGYGYGYGFSQWMCTEWSFGWPVALASDSCLLLPPASWSLESSAYCWRSYTTGKLGLSVLLSQLACGGTSNANYNWVPSIKFKLFFKVWKFKFCLISQLESGWIRIHTGSELRDPGII